MAKKKAATTRRRKPTVLRTVDQDAPLPPGVRELVWVKAKDLPSNPLNWRKHPPRQINRLKASLASNGWAGALLFNRTSGRLIDGHARKQLSPEAVVPVLVGEFTLEQERSILSSLDPISAMAETDATMLRKLTQQVDTDLKKLDELDAEDLAELNKELQSEAEAVRKGASASFFPAPNDNVQLTSASELAEQSEAKGQLEINPRELPDGINIPKHPDNIETLRELTPLTQYQVPKLLAKHLADPPEPDVVTWAGQETPKRSAYFAVWGFKAIPPENASQYTIGFYEDDSKFESAWTVPVQFVTRLLKLQPRAVVTPNFSIFPGDPFPIRLHQNYKSYWTGRWWGELGLKIIPDVLLPADFPADLSWRFEAVPKNAPCIAVELQSIGQGARDNYVQAGQKSLLEVVKLLKPQTLLAYTTDGLPENFFRAFPKQLAIIQTYSYMGTRRAIMPSLKKKRKRSTE